MFAAFSCLSKQCIACCSFVWWVASGLDAQHENAAKYLASTNQKIAWQGLSPGVSPSPAISGVPQQFPSVSPAPSSKPRSQGMLTDSSDVIPRIAKLHNCNKAA